MQLHIFIDNFIPTKFEIIFTSDSEIRSLNPSPRKYKKKEVGPTPLQNDASSFGYHSTKYGESPSDTRQNMATKIVLCLRLCHSLESAIYFMAFIL